MDGHQRGLSPAHTFHPAAGWRSHPGPTRNERTLLHKKRGTTWTRGDKFKVSTALHAALSTPGDPDLDHPPFPHCL